MDACICGRLEHETLAYQPQPGQRIAITHSEYLFHLTIISQKMLFIELHKLSDRTAICELLF